MLLPFNIKYKNKCNSHDNAIDAEVYKSKIRFGRFYGLTEEEIKIVEEKNNTTSLSYRRRPVSTANKGGMQNGKTTFLFCLYTCKQETRHALYRRHEQLNQTRHRT